MSIGARAEVGISVHSEPADPRSSTTHASCSATYRRAPERFVDESERSRPGSRRRGKQHRHATRDVGEADAWEKRRVTHDISS